MVYPALLPLMRTPRLPVVDWTDAPADLNETLWRGGNTQNCWWNNISDFCKLIVIPNLQVAPIELFLWTFLPYGDRGGTVVKVLCYKSEGR